MQQQIQQTQDDQIIIQIDHLLLPVDLSLNECLPPGEDRLHEIALQYGQMVEINILRLIHIAQVIDLVQSIASRMMCGASVNRNIETVDGDRGTMKIGVSLEEGITEDDLYIYLQRYDLGIEVGLVLVLESREADRWHCEASYYRLIELTFLTGQSQ